jgi:hypothetical protein
MTSWLLLRLRSESLSQVITEMTNARQETIVGYLTPFTVSPESVSVVDGKICLEFPSEDRAFFFRFRVE